MTLGELILELEQLDPTTIGPGFCYPHSYRGYYHHVAFEPGGEMEVRETLRCALSAVNAVYEGYKGGEFTMTMASPVWIAHWGQTSGHYSDAECYRLLKVITELKEIDQLNRECEIPL